MRSARYILITLFILCYRGLFAQEFDLYDFRYYKRFDTVEELLAPDPDSVIIAKFVINRKFTTRALDYNISAVRYARRGVSHYDRTTHLNGIEIPFVGDAAIRALQLTQTRETDRTLLRVDSLRAQRTSAGFSFSSRGIPYSVLFSTAQKFNSGWSMAANFVARTGRDLHIQGLYGNSLEFNATTSKRWGDDHTLSLALIAKPSMRSSRLASTKEAFRLTGNNRYNPAWGYQNGKVRNSRVRREFMPTLFAGYEFKIDDKTTLNAALTATIGVERYSSLDWYNAQTPTPDNYHYMPSYFVDETDIFLDVESAWRAGDTRYTQINFDRLIALNRANNGEAVYALSDRVKRTTSGALRIGATSKLEKGALSYGGELTLRRYRNFKQMLDLLGAEYSLDLDYFLEDDTTYGNSLQNNLLTPNRRIVVGDCFGYDYAIREQSLAAYATYSYSTERLNLDISAEIGYCNISRRGFYQKELFAENSLGDSRHIKLMPYSIRANFGYLIAENHFVEATIVSEGKPCDGEELFLQSQYNNRTIDYPSLRSTHSAEVRYLFQKENFAVTTTLFFAADLNNTSVRHSYFDLSSQYADIVISGDNHLRFGLEAEAEYRFAEHFRLTGAFSIARYQYANTPSVTIYSDSSNQLIANQTKSQIKGLSLGNMPQAAATLGLSYFNRGWMANLNMNYAGLRFVEPSQLMRTVRVLTIAYSPEQEAQLMSQERLKDSFTIDLSISKTVRLSRLNRKIYNAPIKPRHKDRGETNRLIFRVGVRNLIGSSDIVYNGYESSRLQRYKLANKYYYNRQDTRYTYCYPRTFYASATFAF